MATQPIKYFKQPNVYSCGPTAILNAFRFQGYLNPLKEVAAITKAIRCKRPYGTERSEIDRFLRQNKIAKHYQSFQSLTSIIKHVKNGDAILIDYLYENDRKSGSRPKHLYPLIGHCALIIGTTKKFFYGVNMFSKEAAVVRISHKKFKRRFLKHKKYWNYKYPIGWIIKHDDSN